MPRNLRLSAACLAAAVLAACSGGGTEPKTPADTTARGLAFTIQPAALWSTGAIPTRHPAIRIVNAADSQLVRPGILVTLEVAGGTGALTGDTAMTDAAGVATFLSVRLTAAPPTTLRLVARAAGLRSDTSDSVTVLPGGHISVAAHRVSSTTTLIVYRMRPDGGDQVVAGTATDAANGIGQNYALAPTGQLLYESYSATVPRIFVVEPFGATRRLTLNDTNVNYEESPVAGADTAWIYYGGGTIGDCCGPELYRVKLDGSQRQRLGVPYSTSGFASAAPSPAGDSVAFARIVAVGTDLFTLDVASGTIDSLGIAGGTVRWSPAGGRLAFIRGTTGQPADLYIMDPNGANQRVLVTGAPFIGGAMSWSPDGHWIIAQTTAGLLLVHVDSPFRLLLPNTQGYDYPFWQP